MEINKDPDPKPQPLEFLTVEEVAKELRVSPKTVYSWCQSGYLPCHKFGRLVKVSRRDLEAWKIARRRIPQTIPA